MAPAKKEESNDFRMYLDERFKGLEKNQEEGFKNLHFRLDFIDKKQEDSDLSVKELSHIVETIRIIDANKCVTCANTKKVAIMETGLSEILFFKKYRKQFIMAGVLSILIFLVGSTTAFIEIKKWIIEDAEQEVRVEENIVKTENLTKRVNTNTDVINNNAKIQKDQLKREDEKNKK